jgi:hypothetical protein
MKKQPKPKPKKKKISKKTSMATTSKKQQPSTQFFNIEKE